jgi:hypothetical protein
MSLDMAELQTENERLAKKPGQNNDFMNNFVKMPAGNGHVVVRILSDTKKQARKGGLYSATRIHKVNNKSLHCLRELVEGRWIGDCPICKYYNYLWRESEKKEKSQNEREALQAKARAIKPIERYYYNTIVRSVINEETQDVEKNVGPRILSIGKTLHQQIIRAITGDKKMEEPGLGDITDVKSGRDFKIMKTMRQSGTESYPNYSDSKFLDPTPAGTPEEIEKWKAGLHDLMALRVLKDWDFLSHQLRIHNGVEKDEADGFDASQYEKAADDEAVVEESVVDEATPVTAAPVTAPTSAAPVEPTPPSGDEALAEADFMKELSSMGDA